MADLQIENFRKINSYWNCFANKNFVCAVIPDHSELSIVQHVVDNSNVPLRISVNSSGIFVQHREKKLYVPGSAPKLGKSNFNGFKKK